MKRLICFILLSSFLYVQTIQAGNIEDGNQNTPEELDETDFTQKQNKNISEEIDLIKNRAGEDKAELYFKNFKDNNIILFLDGFWEMNLLGNLNFEIFNTHTKLNSIQPIFKQEANLSLWLLLNKSFYFETLYKDQFEKSVLAVGYLGKDDSYLKHLRISNSGIKFPTNYGYITTGGGNIIAPGVMAKFSGKNWQTDSVLRYESSEFNSKTYYGKNELIENKISLNEWAKAKYFYIPSSDNNLYGNQISVFVKDTEFSQWRELSRDEFYINPLKKTLNLKQSFPNGAAITYQNIDSDIPNVSNHTEKVKTYFKTQTSLNSNQIEKIMQQLDSANFYKPFLGKKYLILKEKNIFSPFEIASRYGQYSDKTNSSIKIINTNNSQLTELNAGFEETNIFVEGFKKLTFIQISNKNEPKNFSEPAQLFPFKNDAEIYIPQNNKTENFKTEIIYETYIPVADFSLPDKTIAGSIRVYKNKIRIFDFEYDEKNHLLKLNTAIHSNDLIEVQWQEGKIYSESGMVRFAGGIHWQPLNFLDLFFAASGDWVIDKQKKQLTDDYKLSTGIDFFKYNIKTGSHFGFNALAERDKKPNEQNYIFKNKTYFEYNLREVFYQKNNVPIFSNPYVYIDGNIETANKKESLQFNSKMKTSLDIWKIKLSGQMSLQNTNKNTDQHIIESYGHTVNAPIYFFTMYENFFVNQNQKLLQRENFLSFNKFVTAKLVTGIDYTKEFTSQKITASIMPDIPKTKYGIFYTELYLILNQKYKTLSDIFNSGYTNSWKNSLKDMYSSGKNNSEYRNSELKFIFNMFTDTDNENTKNIKFLGCNFVSYTRSNFSGKNLSEQTKFSMSFPFKTKSIFFTPIWERQILKQKPEEESSKQKKYAHDLKLLFTGMGEQYWFFSKPVLYDLFDQKINSQIQLQNKNIYSFINLYGINISRLIGNKISDLYLPVETDISLSRIVKSEKTDNAAMNIYSVDFLVRYITLNISGKYGFFKVFKWYEQDELNRKYNYLFAFGKDYFKFKLDAEHSLYYYFQNDNKLGFENKFLINTVKTANTKLHTENWKNKFSCIFLYSEGTSLPALIIKTFSKIYLSNIREEKISLEFSQRSNQNKLDYKIGFSHSQTTNIGEHGSIKLFAEIEGSTSQNNSFLMNLNIGISGKIEY